MVRWWGKGVTTPGTIYWGRYLLPFDGSPKPVADGAIFVETGAAHVMEVGDLGALRASHPGAREVGGADRLVMPGLIDAHQHGRALTPSELGCRDEELELWLLEQRAIPRPDPALSALVAAARSILGGVTTLVHPHVTGHPEKRLDEAAAVAAAYVRSGARVTFGIDVRDRASFTYAEDEHFLSALPEPVATEVRRAFGPPPPTTLDEIDEELSSLQAQTAGTLVQIVLAPRGPQWCTGETLEWIAQRQRDGTAIQMHCSETRAQYGWFAERGDSPVRFLDRYGLLSEATTLAHCVWLDEADVRLLADSGTRVVHNPSSNLRLGSGRAPVSRLRSEGVPVAIGTDSMGLVEPVDLFAEIRLARWLEQAPAGRFTGGASEGLRAALRAGALAAGRDEVVGVLAPGAAADIVLLDLSALTAAVGDEHGDDDVHELAAQRARRQHVSDVVIGGRELVRDGRYLPHELGELEQELRDQVRESSPAPAPREAVAQLRPYVESELRRLHALSAEISFVE